MHRTQLYLDDHHFQILRSRARREGRTLAAIVRGILDEHFGLAKSGRAHDPIEKVIGLGRGDGTAVAKNYEDYLYGE